MQVRETSIACRSFPSQDVKVVAGGGEEALCSVRFILALPGRAFDLPFKERGKSHFDEGCG